MHFNETPSQKKKVIAEVVPYVLCVHRPKNFLKGEGVSALGQSVIFATLRFFKKTCLPHVRLVKLS